MVPNGSFENFAQCPVNRNDGRRATGWETPPTDGTSDYFNQCATGEVDVPVNLFGSQTPRTGSAYMGIFCRASIAEYREYLQVSLDTALVAGVTYDFGMYVSLAENSAFGIKKLGAFFASFPIFINTTENLNFNPQVVSNSFLVDKAGWTKVSGSFVANGGEKYLIIGAFEPVASNTVIAVSGGSNDPFFQNSSYYYIDDVSLVRRCDIPLQSLGADVILCDTQYNPVGLASSDTMSNTTYVWNTGELTRSIIATTPGAYTVEISTSYCKVRDTVNVSFTRKPWINLGPDTTLCNTTMILNATSPFANSYLWNTGSTNPLFRPLQSGTYIVVASAGTCRHSDTIDIVINTVNPFQLADTIELCRGTSTSEEIRNNPQARYLWSTGETTQSIKLESAGIYWGEAIVGPCRYRDSVTIIVNDPPAVKVPSDTALCFYEPYTIRASGTGSFLWQDGSVADTFVAKQAGTYWVKVKNNFCDATATIVLSQKTLPVLDLGPDRMECPLVPVVLTAGNLQNAGDKYTWFDGAEGETKTVHAPGTFYVTAVSVDGCEASDTVSIDTFPASQTSLGPDTIVCPGVVYTLVPQNNFVSFTWQDQFNGAQYDATKPGVYSVIATDRNGCRDTASMQLSHYAAPLLSMPSRLLLCDPDTLITVKSNANIFIWQDGSSGSSYRVTGYGKYSVTVTDSNLCKASAELNVESNCPGVVFVPNVFTPENRDGLNDVFLPVTRNVKTIHMMIYTRWGELIFETNDLQKGWDGSYKNQPAQSDVYVYTIDYVGFSGLPKTLTGNVSLLK